MVEGGNSKKVREREVSGVNEPFESKGSEKIREKIGNRPQSEPKGIDVPQEHIKIFERNLEKKNNDDSKSDDEGENDSF